MQRRKMKRSLRTKLWRKNLHQERKARQLKSLRPQLEYFLFIFYTWLSDKVRWLMFLPPISWDILILDGCRIVSLN
uniref:Uncharacterized protein n=1 Tax=Glycine max TaxID=3847 RepID=C6TMN9_SOYBN|nr:unknown [Glycine max]